MFKINLTEDGKIVDWQKKEFVAFGNLTLEAAKELYEKAFEKVNIEKAVEDRILLCEKDWFEKHPEDISLVIEEAVTDEICRLMKEVSNRKYNIEDFITF
jgi:hypothetical protein